MWQVRKPWHSAAAWAWALIIIVPMLAVVVAALESAWRQADSRTSWYQLLDTPHLLASSGMTLWTGLVSSLLAWVLTAWLLSRLFGTPAWTFLLRVLAPMLAVPHAAFAVGLVLLIAPSGWLARIVSPWLTGWTAPPPALITAQDPWGLSLIVMLVAKEIPFLLWAAATQLQRDDVGARWLCESQAAQSMGYSARRAFWWVVWPQLAPRMLWPFAAVLAYSLTVVDVALIIGPSNPSTLAVLAWQWLQDADGVTNVQGAQLGWLLAIGVAASVALVWAMMRGFAHWRARVSLHTGTRGQAARPHRPASGTWILAALYAGVLAALAVGSFTGIWPFPTIVPGITLEAWGSVAGSSQAITRTLILAMSSSLLALLWCLVWLEFTNIVLPARHDVRLRPLLYMPLLLPAVLWVVGLHRVALGWMLGAGWPALIMAHTLAVLPYVLIALSPAYVGFDRRYAQISASLGQRYPSFLLRVKLPMLRAAIAASFAVGVAVSVAQFLPTMYLGEGRFVTVTTEAVTLSSGGQRSLMAAYAWLQWLIPVLAFGLAAYLGKTRFATMRS
jgi:putative thiamine transport system permease protein